MIWGSPLIFLQWPRCFLSVCGVFYFIKRTLQFSGPVPDTNIWGNCPTEWREKAGESRHRCRRVGRVWGKVSLHSRLGIWGALWAPQRGHRADNNCITSGTFESRLLWNNLSEPTVVRVERNLSYSESHRTLLFAPICRWFESIIIIFVYWKLSNRSYKH